MKSNCEFCGGTTEMANGLVGGGKFFILLLCVVQLSNLARDEVSCNSNRPTRLGGLCVWKDPGTAMNDGRLRRSEDAWLEVQF